MKWILLIPVLLLSCLVCAKERPPELWSGFADLDKSQAACLLQSLYQLQEFGLTNLVENKHGIYGNVNANRVVVKCIAITPSTSKLMVAVAGSDRDSVELIRNQVLKRIK